MKLTEKLLVRLSFVASMTGIIILAFVGGNSSSLTIDNFSGKITSDSDVVFSGRVLSVQDRNGMVNLMIERTVLVPVTFFADGKTPIVEGNAVIIHGEITEFNGKKYVLAESISAVK